MSSSTMVTTDTGEGDYSKTYAGTGLEQDDWSYIFFAFRKGRAKGGGIQIALLRLPRL